MMFGLRRVHAFSLVELTLALGIAAFCLIAVFGLVPIGVQTNRNATSQTAATNIMAAVVADLRATPKANNTSSQFSITFGTCRKLYFDSEGQVVASGACDQLITVPPTSRYQLNVTFSQQSPTPTPPRNTDDLCRSQGNVARRGYPGERHWFGGNVGRVRQELAR